jgi:hypothetical protein
MSPALGAIHWASLGSPAESILAENLAKLRQGATEYVVLKPLPALYETPKLAYMDRNTTAHFKWNSPVVVTTLIYE